MRCLKEHILTRYLDAGYTGKEAESIKNHILECSRCRKKMEEIKKEKEFISQKIEIFSPEDIPERDFQFSGPGRIFSFNPLAAAVVVILVLFMVASIWIVLQNKENKIHPGGITDMALEKRERQSIIRRISIAGQPVQTYIFRDPANKTTMIWVEKKVKRENKNAEKI
jgi:hypothetical protein